jgi:DNA-binding transcriptional LysR family regulator
MKSNDDMGPIHAMNFAAFDLNLLRVFDALMRERSVSRAGEQIGLSQPAVSAALGRLRDLLGDRLFVRQGNDMCPTPRAESLAPGIRDALEALELLLGEDRDFDPKAQDRTFTLLGGDFFSSMVVPELASRIARQSERIALRFLDSARGEVERFLKDDVIDLALERPLDVPEWIETEHLFFSPFKIIVARRHPLVRDLDPAVPLPLDIFCALPWAIRSIDGSTSGLVDEALAAVGHRRRVMLAVPHFHGLVHCVAHGNLAAAVPQQMLADLGRDFLVLDPPFDIPVPEIKLYWHQRHTRNPAHRWLRGQVLDICRKLEVA